MNIHRRNNNNNNNNNFTNIYDTLIQPVLRKCMQCRQEFMSTSHRKCPKCTDSLKRHILRSNAFIEYDNPDLSHRCLDRYFPF